MESINNRYKDWLAQADDDLLCAEDTLKSNHFSQVCFLCQQGGEKAIKALAYFKGVSLVKSHSILAISRIIKENGELEKAGRYLDRFYISARYPDAYPEGYPAQYIDKEEAEKALDHLRIIISTVWKYINENRVS